MTAQLWIFILLWKILIYVTGYDGYSSCSRPLRASKAYPDPPCNFQLQNWCTIPGSAYPWHAVRRFVRENQGLMRRMYGEQRHISVLRAEIESNELDIFSDEELKLREHARRRYSDTGASSSPINLIRDRISSQYYHSISNIRISAKIPQNVKPTSPTKPKFNSTVLSLTNTTFKASYNVTEAVSQTNLFSTLTTESHLLTTNDINNTEQKEYSATAGFTVDEPTTFSTTNPSVPTFSLTTDTQPPTETTITNSMPTVFEPTDGTSVETTYTTAATTTPSTTTTTTTSTTSAESPLKQATDITEKHSNHQLFQDVKHQEIYIPPSHKLKGVNACPVKEEVVAPFWANNTRGEVLALLNLYPFEQYVHWEKCTHEHKQMYCREGCRCEQQYRLHRLLAYDPKNECRGIFSDWFKFPSCCLCKCYDLPAQFHITSRSPREGNRHNPSSSPADWYHVAEGG